MPTEKISVDPIALVGVALTLVAMTAGATAFITDQPEKSETVLLENQVGVLEDQIKMRDQEIQENDELLRQIYEMSEGYPKIMTLVEGAIKEREATLDSTDLDINEAVAIPGTTIAIAYESFARYPVVDSVLRAFRILPGAGYLRYLIPSFNTLTINDGPKTIVTNIFPRAGSVIQFAHDNDSYRLVILLVREERIKLSVTKDQTPRLK